MQGAEATQTQIPIHVLHAGLRQDRPLRGSFRPLPAPAPLPYCSPHPPLPPPASRSLPAPRPHFSPPHIPSCLAPTPLLQASAPHPRSTCGAHHSPWTNQGDLQPVALPHLLPKLTVTPASAQGTAPLGPVSPTLGFVAPTHPSRPHSVPIQFTFCLLSSDRTTQLPWTLHIHGNSPPQVPKLPISSLPGAPCLIYRNFTRSRAQGRA